MPYCLPKNYLEKVKAAIKEGKFDMEKFNTTSETRRLMLAEIVGMENAEAVNTIYEQKLLLKNQEAAMYRFVKDITGLTDKEKESTAAKLRATLEEKRRRLYEPGENENFLNEITSDIYTKKFKTEVSLDEAQTITEMAQDMKDAKAKLNTEDPMHPTWASKEEGLKYGASKVALDNYTNGLKLKAVKSEWVNIFKERGVVAKLEGVLSNAKTSVNFIAENSRAIVASIDDSFWGRQGLRALLDPRLS
jgi:hypothetical protein